MSEFEEKVELKIGSNRSFGITLGVIITLIFLYFNTFHEWMLLPILILGLSLFFLGIFYPRILTYPNIIWFKFGLFLGKIISPIVMSIIFIVTIIPIGFFMKLLKKDLLLMKFDASQSSYWVNKEEKKTTMSDQY